MKATSTLRIVSKFKEAHPRCGYGWIDNVLQQWWEPEEHICGEEEGEWRDIPIVAEKDA